MGKKSNSSASSGQEGPNDGVAEIRRLEAEALTDRKNANNILEIRRRAEAQIQSNDGSDSSKEIQMAAVHSLRRIFCDILESGVILATKSTTSSASSSSAASLQKYAQWIISQINSYIDLLCWFIHDEDIGIQAVAIRTLMELVMREHMYKPEVTFGVHTYRKLLLSLLLGADIDVDVLLMFRDEVLDKADCIFYSLRTIRTFLAQLKEVQKEISPQSDERNRQEIISNFVRSGGSGFGAHLNEKIVQSFRFTVCTQNVLDILRIIEVPGSGEDDEEMMFCVDSEEPSKAMKGEGRGSVDDDDDDSVSEDSDHEELEEEEEGPRIVGARGRPMNRKKQSNKSRKYLSIYHQIRDIQTHKNLFSKAWLSLLALPLTRAQHKIILRHLPESVLPDMSQPILIADYITRSMDCGGYTAVLALEGLFNLIVKYNLDYPKYFECLYKLCTRENFAARYRSKFLELVCSSLKSTNIPAYTAAAFIKKFCHLGLFGETPTCCFCIAMVITLLRAHPKCIVMIHREPGDDYNPEPFDDKGSTDFEKMEAIRSSLWEIQALQDHKLPQVANLAKFLENPDSTDVTKPPTDPRDYIHMTYESMIEQEVNKVKEYKKKLEAQEEEILEEVAMAEKTGRKVDRRTHKAEFDYTQTDSPAPQTLITPVHFFGKNDILRQELDIPYLGEVEFDPVQEQEWMDENYNNVEKQYLKRLAEYEKKITAGGKDEYDFFTPYDPKEEERRRRRRENPMMEEEEEEEEEIDESDDQNDDGSFGKTGDEGEDYEGGGYGSDEFDDENEDQDNELF